MRLLALQEDFTELKSKHASTVEELEVAHKQNDVLLKHAKDQIREIRELEKKYDHLAHENRRVVAFAKVATMFRCLFFHISFYI